MSCCAGMTKEEACALLDAIDKAINAMVLGQRIDDMSVGSVDFNRRFRFSSLSMDDLRKLRADVADYLKQFCQNEPVWRKYGCVPLITTNKI